MNIGIVMKHFNTARMLQEDLSKSNEVTIYHSAEECLEAILEARFCGRDLHNMILVDLDLEEVSGPEFIRRVRLFIKKSELTFILMNGKSSREEEIAHQHLLDTKIKMIYKDTSVIFQELRKAAGGNQ